MKLPCPASGCVCIYDWPCGPTDKASDYESGDCRFESCQGQHFWTLHKNSMWDKNGAPPGGLEPPTFRLTAERASQLRHGGFITVTAASPLELKSQNLLSCFQRTCALMRPQQASLSSVRYGLVVRIPGSHPGGPGSIPGNGNPFWTFTVNSLVSKECFKCRFDF